MREFLAANPKDKHGAHRYGLEEFGLDPQAERQRYRFYTEGFGVESEVDVRGADSRPDRVG